MKTLYQDKIQEYIEMALNWETPKGYESWVQALECEFAKKYNIPYAVAFNSGTSTLHAGLVALGVKPGDKVAIPALTVAMDTFAILQARAIPVYIDIDPITLNMDVEDLNNKLYDNPVKVVMPVSLYGLPPELDRIKRLSHKYGYKILEDNAQSMLNTLNGKLVGTFGDVASYSFESSKHLNSGEGGIVITVNPDIALKCRKFGGLGYTTLTPDLGRTKLTQDTFQNPAFARHDTMGYNYRLSEYQAAMVLAQLEHVEEFLKWRHMSAMAYLNVIHDESFQDELTPQGITPGYTHSWWAFTAKFVSGGNWEWFRKRYIKNGGDGIYGAWRVTYNEPFMKEYNSYLKGSCPVAESVQPHLMQFKTNYYDEDTINKKAEALRKTIKDFKKSFTKWTGAK